jgi:hypothetical protein
MTNLTKLAAFALVALSASTTFASAMVIPSRPPLTRLGPTTTHSPAELDCKVRGADFYITNFGSDNVDSGRQVAWNSPTSDDSGVVLLPRMLAPGESVKLADVLSDFVLPGSPCTVAFV